MRTCLIAIIMEARCAGNLKAQTADCVISGYLFNQTDCRLLWHK